jgi:hypothetical protein
MEVRAKNDEKRDPTPECQFFAVKRTLMELLWVLGVWV